MDLFSLPFRHAGRIFMACSLKKKDFENKETFTVVWASVHSFLITALK